MLDHQLTKRDRNMIKVGFACVFGASTYYVCDMVKKSAKARNIEVEMEAFPVSDIDEMIHKFDIILLGPQSKYKAKDVGALAEQHGKKFRTIPADVYGSMEGDRVLDFILEVDKG